MGSGSDNMVFEKVSGPHLIFVVVFVFRQEFFAGIYTNDKKAQGKENLMNGSSPSGIAFAPVE